MARSGRDETVVSNKYAKFYIVTAMQVRSVFRLNYLVSVFILGSSCYRCLSRAWHCQTR